MQSGFVRSLSDGLDRLTAPIYRPIRKIMPDFGGLDFSPLVVLLAIQIVRMLLTGIGDGSRGLASMTGAADRRARRRRRAS